MRKKKSTQQLVGIESVTDSSVLTAGGELTFYLVQPTNLNVLPESGVRTRVTALLNKALMRATISEALGLNGDPEEVDMLERKVEALNNKMLALVNESVSSGDGIEAHESEFMTLSQETELLKQRIAAIQESTARDNGEQNRLEQIQAIIAERERKCMEYDDSIVRQMVECIKVYPGGKLEIIFGGGYLVEETV